MAHCSSPSSKKGFCPFSLFLFAGTAIATVRHLRRAVVPAADEIEEAPTASPDESVVPEPPPIWRVVFVLGGPGAGKGTQCQLLSEHHGWCHLSAGDLLRAERSKKIGSSSLADVINSAISAGRIVPSEITVELIKNAMMEESRRRCRRRGGGEDAGGGGGRTKFLIDGFPRSGGNVDAWNAVVGDAATVEAVLFFECPEDVLTSRLLERSKTSGRNDDTIDVIRKRFDTYREESVPIVEMYERVGKVRKIIADRSIEEVYREVESILGE